MWQRLDHALFNINWINKWVSTKVEHLNQTLCDHSPIIISVPSVNLGHDIKKQFRFKICDFRILDFLDIVYNNWKEPF